MIIQHNMAAMGAQRNYNVSTSIMSKSAEKLSSGYKINRAADNASGLAISEKMRSMIRGLDQGTRNAQDGISVCQVADGALGEVQSMLHRMTQLSVQAANDTNTTEERMAIQEEINQILAEINRIGDSTEFNRMPLFKGFEDIYTDASGNPVIEGNIPFSSFKLADVDLGLVPFSGSSSADHNALQAIVSDPASPANGKVYNLIFGQGSTSNSSFRLSYNNNGSDVQAIVKLDTLTASGCSGDVTSSTNPLKRTFTYTNADGVNISITQSISVDETSNPDEKNYNISYTFENNSQGIDINVDFMFHADTAYNNNDRCEGYYINNARVQEYCVYKSTANSAIDVAIDPDANIIGNPPQSISIIDVDSALPFSEKITFGGDPDISIGVYSRIDDWSYYDNLDSELGIDADRKDLGFSLMWDMNLTAGSSSDQLVNKPSFTYGIVAAEKDTNINAIQINPSTSYVSDHYDALPLWIQSGANENVGMYILIGEMNTDVLGITGLDVTTFDGAQHAITATQEAVTIVSQNRGRIGAQQNRLEHAVNYNENASENQSAAESRIRDTDMAEEMVNYSKASILTQAGQAMMAQANASTQGVLNLLQ